MGDFKFAGDGVYELRINADPGWRVYFGQAEDLVVLLGGGMKRTQKRDLAVMKSQWKEYSAKKH